ncbi:hypothetical protein A2160_00105 [Candidatus Beckwithbacteria bacterium RBG_13_42_9]|uniref:DUF4878 domain-containing protein n=1 Tax=Candidatus Beckwithbacteria bacterium RBG_13_42_9 TaxID=1797457 RepID=A0A1F5E523_9BACT|nr:MAG: hypothetical protein A2160_00105 [Candidatus Beckwithbacteria bacterium RBG_13_42_9]
MKKTEQLKIIVGFIVIFVLGIGIWYWLSHRIQPTTSLPLLSTFNFSPIPQAVPPQTSAYPNQPVKEQAKQVIQNFMDNFIKGFPPNLNEGAIMAALNLLSTRARASISQIGPSPSAALASFVGIQNAPDQGYTIDQIFEDKGTATVETTWKYGSGNVQKTFSLVFEDNRWKIDSISR